MLDGDLSGQAAAPARFLSTELATARLTHAVTLRMFFSGLLRYNSADDSFSTNLRLPWEYISTPTRSARTAQPRVRCQHQPALLSLAARLAC